MKKILLPFEGGHYPQELLDFAALANAVDPILLTAAFVPESDYSTMLEASGIVERPIFLSSQEEEDRVAQQYGGRIMRFCNGREIRHRLRFEQDDLALPTLERESRFADLMLLSASHFMEDLNKRQPNVWLKNLLRGSECPALILPDHARMPGEIILCYDGSAESVFAIKQFAYLFPEFSRVQATLIYINDDAKATIPDEEEIKDLCKMHFRKLRVGNLKLRCRDFYDAWIGMLNDPWVVAGSYGRSAFSDMLKHSFSAELINKHRIPVFVAHR